MLTPLKRRLTVQETLAAYRQMFKEKTDQTLTFRYAGESGH